MANRASHQRVCGSMLAACHRQSHADVCAHRIPHATQRSECLRGIIAIDLCYTRQLGFESHSRTSALPPPQVPTLLRTPTIQHKRTQIYTSCTCLSVVAQTAGGKGSVTDAGVVDRCQKYRTCSVLDRYTRTHNTYTYAVYM